MYKVREKRQSNVSGLMRFAATQLAVAGYLSITLPGTAATIPTTYENQFRSCTGRLLSVGVSSQATASACAGALNPVDLSKCVAKIKQRTALAADDALSYCRQVRRPPELANCVVGISSNNQQAPVRSVLDYCGRSLLPEVFARCVVGLHLETNVASTQAMDNCITATDQLPPNNFAPTFVPQNGEPPILPAVTPTLPQTQNQVAPAPLSPENQAVPPGQLNSPAPVPQNQVTPPNP